MLRQSGFAAVVLLACVASISGLARAESAATTQPAFVPIRNEHLHNAHRVTDRVISGAQPDDEAAFQALQALGVKTIISVDGAKPDAATAAKCGMRYVHLPIGYDGVPVDQGKAIAKALIELEGPFYIHCHHGKHRSAAAVAVACIITGDLRPEQADSVLKTFGTGANYEGLWADARSAKKVDVAELHAISVKFVEAAVIPPLADAMVHVDERFDHLKAAQEAGWKSVPNHPDIDPPHEALMLRELFHEMNRSEDILHRSEDFRERMQQSEEEIQRLEDLLVAWKTAGHPDPAPAEINTAFKAVGESCKSCHKDWRD